MASLCRLLQQCWCALAVYCWTMVGSAYQAMHVAGHCIRPCNRSCQYDIFRFWAVFPLFAMSRPSFQCTSVMLISTGCPIVYGYAGYALELASPIFPSAFLLLACLGSIARAITGVPVSALYHVHTASLLRALYRTSQCCTSMGASSCMAVTPLLQLSAPGATRKGVAVGHSHGNASDQ